MHLTGNLRRHARRASQGRTSVPRTLLFTQDIIIYIEKLLFTYERPKGGHPRPMCLATHQQHISNTLATHQQHTCRTPKSRMPWQHISNTLATHEQHISNTLATHQQHIDSPKGDIRTQDIIIYIGHYYLHTTLLFTYERPKGDIRAHVPPPVWLPHRRRCLDIRNTL